MSSNIEKADRLSRARAIAAPFFGLAVMSAQQWLFFGRDWAAVSRWQLVVWTILAATALVIVATGGGWLIPPRYRSYVDDESARENRRDALSIGFVAAMCTAMMVFVVSPWEPIEAQRAAHLIFSIGLGSSLLAFGLAERRAHA